MGVIGRESWAAWRRRSSAAEEGDAFVQFVGDLAGVLCARHERIVGNDNCVRFEGWVLQIPEQRHRRHFVKVTVQVREYPDGTLALYHGPRRLAGYTGDGALIIEQEGPATSAA